MILLNACSSKKICLDDSSEFYFFSVIPDPSKEFQMHNFDDIITDEKTASFLRDFEIEWLRSEDGEQLLGVRVEADEDVCREFLKSLIIDAEVLLNNE